MTVTAEEENKHLISVTKVKVKVQTGEQGPKAGLVFLSTSDVTSEAFSEQLKAFDEWTREDYIKLDQKRCVPSHSPYYYKRIYSREENDLLPIAYFELDKERLVC